MQRVTVLKLIALTITAFFMTFVYAATDRVGSILDNSVKWDDEAGRTAALTAVPEWHNATVQQMFDLYLHQEKYKLPATSTTQQYNVQFINAFWGPLANPFNKSPRPAKAFLIFSASSFYMAPLVKNLADGNYYVFDKAATRPVVLSEWITNMTTAHGKPGEARFNVCNGYASLPTETCSEKSYQAELVSRSMRNEHTENPSAKRAMHEDWRSNVASIFTTENSILGGSISWSQNDNTKAKLLNTTTSWANFKTISDNFEKLRDIRYFSDTEKKGFSRRISWLFPDDGCWTRAAAVMKDLFGPFENVVNNYQRPSKVFAFGNLCVNTTNSSSGSVSWWYHTAPIIKDAETNQIYVLDPAVAPQKPLTLEKWMAEISSRSGACADSNGSVDKFAICNGYGSNPYDQCNSSFQSEAAEVTRQISFQQYERSRQVQLGREADAVLGNQPPWKNS